MTYDVLWIRFWCTAFSFYRKGLKIEGMDFKAFAAIWDMQFRTGVDILHGFRSMY